MALTSMSRAPPSPHMDALDRRFVRVIFRMQQRTIRNFDGWVAGNPILLRCGSRLIASTVLPARSIPCQLCTSDTSEHKNSDVECLVPQQLHKSLGIRTAQPWVSFLSPALRAGVDISLPMACAPSNLRNFTSQSMTILNSVNCFDDVETEKKSRCTFSFLSHNSENVTPLEMIPSTSDHERVDHEYLCKYIPRGRRCPPIPHACIHIFITCGICSSIFNRCICLFIRRLASRVFVVSCCLLRWLLLLAGVLLSWCCVRLGRFSPCFSTEGL